MQKPITFRAYSSVGRALRSQRRGHGFESHSVHPEKRLLRGVFFRGDITRGIRTREGRGVKQIIRWMICSRDLEELCSSSAGCKQSAADGRIPLGPPSDRGPRKCLHFWGKGAAETQTKWSKRIQSYNDWNTQSASLAATHSYAIEAFQTRVLRLKNSLFYRFFLSFFTEINDRFTGNPRPGSRLITTICCRLSDKTSAGFFCEKTSDFEDLTWGRS